MAPMDGDLVSLLRGVDDVWGMVGVDEEERALRPRIWCPLGSATPGRTPWSWHTSC